ncbi:hypothetical protein [Chryseobacterium populi]|uniref:Uncharacterized protein n=1 Tax=Chryseobacterium populi TaxID=1144316 RepID=J2KMV5_9FLAO|nr:hypothetical protein [Chryseobacterium populi]EJL74423.1 hypothetical protein PMI13_01162 [Chryseobacterium populi]
MKDLDSSFSSLLENVFGDTLNQVIMDLYINFQDSLDEDLEGRTQIFETLQNCFTVMESHCYRLEVRQVIDYIFENGPKVPIPDVWKNRIRDAGRYLSEEQFYRYSKPAISQEAERYNKGPKR